MHEVHRARKDARSREILALQGNASRQGGGDRDIQMKTHSHTVIVGGTTELGQALARQFVQRGTVSVIGRRSAPISSPRVHGYTADIADAGTVETTLDRIVARGGAVRRLIFLQRFSGTGKRWEGEIQTSLIATRAIIDYLTGKFVDRGDRSIVITLSAASRYVAVEQPLAYHVAKGGLEQMVRYYAATLGSSGIRVNAVSPSTMLKASNRAFYKQHAALATLYRSLSPLGRMCTVRDVADVIGFLASPRSSFLTGQNLIVDGGISLIWHETMARGLAGMQSLKVTRLPS